MAKAKTYDLVVIGSGPGGYVAAVRAAQLGMKTACIEKENRLGGVCLNVGCIPSKALLDSSEYYHLAGNHFHEHGVRMDNIRLDLKTLMARKEQVVKELTDNVRKLLQGNQIDIIHGTARLTGENRVAVKSKTGAKTSTRTLQARHILLATGSAPISVPGIDFDHKRIVSSTDVLSFKTIPKHLAIIGGG